MQNAAPYLCDMVRHFAYFDSSIINIFKYSKNTDNIYYILLTASSERDTILATYGEWRYIYGSKTRNKTGEICQTCGSTYE